TVRGSPSYAAGSSPVVGPPSSSSNGIWLPNGEFEGESSRTISRASTWSLMTCSHRQASSCTYAQSKPNTSAAMHSDTRCTLMHIRTVQTNHICKKSFRQAMLPHDRSRSIQAFFGQLQPTVRCNMQQPVTLHPCHCLRPRGARMFQTLGNSCTQRRDTFFHQFIDGA